MRQALLLCFLALTALRAGELSIMTFNVRYPNPDDGDDAWPRRRDLLVRVIAKYSPDVMGTQELFYEQGEYIATKLPGYAWFGVSRRGNREDEHMGVFYRKDRLRLLDSGDFWLSPTPEKPGSSAWGMSLPRMVTWGLFEDLSAKKRFLLMNTHFAHRAADEQARQKAAQLIAGRLALQDEDLPVVLTGDFNAPAGGKVHQILTAQMQDAWLQAADRSGPEGTFHGFRGKPGKDRIDWILYRAPWRVLRAETIAANENGRYPSDHFAVLAIFNVP